MVSQEKDKKRVICRRNDNRLRSVTLLANTPAKAESLMHRLEQTEGNISLYMNANKIKSSRVLNKKWQNSEMSRQVYKTQQQISHKTQHQYHIKRQRCHHTCLVKSVDSY